MITTIVTKFVEMQRVNPMAAVEALFRYQSKEIKDDVLSNYEKSDFQAAQMLDERIVYEDEEAAVEEEAFEQPIVEQKDQWTQEQDEILIENYQQFSSLPKKERYMVLAELVGGNKTFQDCYKRAKILKVKKADKEMSKAISTDL